MTWLLFVVGLIIISAVVFIIHQSKKIQDITARLHNIAIDKADLSEGIAGKVYVIYENPSVFKAVLSNMRITLLKDGIKIYKYTDPNTYEIYKTTIIAHPFEFSWEELKQLGAGVVASIISSITEGKLSLTGFKLRVLLDVQTPAQSIKDYEIVLPLK